MSPVSGLFTDKETLPYFRSQFISSSSVLVIARLTLVVMDPSAVEQQYLPVLRYPQTILNLSGIYHTNTNSYQTIPITETIPHGPLYYAIKLHLTDAAISLITEQNVNETSSLGRSALGITCTNGSIEVIKLFFFPPPT